MKYTSLALLAAAGVLAGCGGSSGSSPLNPSNNSGYFRFVNGSADAGPVDFYVDGNLVQSGVGYGRILAYQKESAGAHTIAIYMTGTKTPIPGVASTSLSQSVNNGQYVSLVLVGEQHPTVGTDTPNLLAFTDQMYSTSSGGFSVDFHNAAGTTGAGSTQFSISSGTNAQDLGGTVNVGGATQPVAVSNTFVGANIPVTFTATPASGASATVTPSLVDSSGCAANTLPCNSGNLSLYFIDGPSASSAPNVGTLPSTITSSSQTTGFAAIFDANGT